MDRTRLAAIQVSTPCAAAPAATQSLSRAWKSTATAWENERNRARASSDSSVSSASWITGQTYPVNGGYYFAV